MNENIVVLQQLPKALQEAVDGYKNQEIIIHEPRGDHGKRIASANSFSICSAGTLEELLEELAGHEIVSVMTYEQAIAEAGRPFAEAILKFADWKKPDPVEGDLTSILIRWDIEDRDLSGYITYFVNPPVEP